MQKVSKEKFQKKMKLGFASYVNGVPYILELDILTQQTILVPVEITD